MKAMRYGDLLAAVLYPAMALCAYFFYPGSYSPLHNWLSDLGNSLVNPGGAIFYNGGSALGCSSYTCYY